MTYIDNIDDYRNKFDEDWKQIEKLLLYHITSTLNSKANYHSHDVPSEILNRVALKVWINYQKHELYNQELSNLRVYATKVADYTIMQYFQKEKSESKKYTRANEAQNVFEIQQAIPIDIIPYDNAEVSDAFMNLLSEVAKYTTADELRMLYYARILDLPPIDVAAWLGIDYGNFRTRLTRIKNKLSEKIEPSLEIF